MPKCPPLWHFEQRKHVKPLIHENFGKFQLKLRPADAMTFFCSSLEFWAETWASAGVLTFFFGLHLILGGKLGICQRDDLQKSCPFFAQ